MLNVNCGELTDATVGSLTNNFEVDFLHIYSKKTSVAQPELIISPILISFCS